MDGDTDTVPVQEDFKQVVREHINYLKNSSKPLSHIRNGGIGVTAEDNFSEINTISKKIGNGTAMGMANGVNQMANGMSHMVNGYGSLKAPPLARTIGRNGDVNFREGHN